MTRLLFAVVAWMLPVTVLAQMPPDPEESLGKHDPPYGYMLSVTRVARPGMHDAVEGFYLKLRAAETALGLDAAADVYAVRGSDRHVYVSRRGLSSFADASLDPSARARRVLTDVYGAGEAARLMAQLAAATAEVSTEIAAVLPERNQFRYPEGRVWPVLEVRRASRPPRDPQPVPESSPEEGATFAPPPPVPPYVRSVVTAGETTTHLTTLLFRSINDRHAWASAQVEGDEAPDDVMLLEYRPDLSQAGPGRLTRHDR